MLAHVIHADNNSLVIGVASVDKLLFVLRSLSQQRIQAYDLTTFKLQLTLEVRGLCDNECTEMTACDVNKCLYVSDYKNGSVHKIPLTADNKLRAWSVGGGPTGLSINTTRNFLVACWHDEKIKEYKTTSGSLVREICPKSQNGVLLRPQHVIQLASGQLVAGCCIDYWMGRVHNVVLVDFNGRVEASYKIQLQSTIKTSFSSPRQIGLAVDKNNDCILAADRVTIELLY